MISGGLKGKQEREGREGMVDKATTRKSNTVASRHRRKELGNFRQVTFLPPPLPGSVRLLLATTAVRDSIVVAGYSVMVHR